MRYDTSGVRQRGTSAVLELLKGINFHLLISLVFAGFLLTTLFVLCFQFTSDQPNQASAIPTNIAVFVAGWATGWVAGTLVAPYDKGEATLFSQISKGIWAFVSGYLLGKIDPLFSALREAKIIPMSDVLAFRILLYLSVSAIIMLVVFFARKYANWHLPADDVATPD